MPQVALLMMVMHLVVIVLTCSLWIFSFSKITRQWLVSVMFMGAGSNSLCENLVATAAAMVRLLLKPPSYIQFSLV